MKILLNEALSKHTTFKVGGPARRYLILQKEDIAALFSDARRSRRKGRRLGGALPLYPLGTTGVSAPLRCTPCSTRRSTPCSTDSFFLIGKGSNIVAPDEGFDGTVVDTTRLRGIYLQKQGKALAITALAGTSCSRIAAFAAKNSLTGLEFLWGLPGTIGGAVFMNARCYEREVSDCLDSAYYIEKDGFLYQLVCKKEDFDYKSSPFQAQSPIKGASKTGELASGGFPLRLILGGTLRVEPGDKAKILQIMENYLADRIKKGHFLYPCAGSVFKNNRDFGKPTGKIIEELGLRGTQIGGARIADWHGNIIVNTGNATAAEIKSLVELVQEKAQSQLNIRLEPEVIFLPAQAR